MDKKELEKHLDKHLYRIPIHRQALANMPDNVRAAVLLLGHIGNELNTFSQLLMFSVRPQDDPILDKLTMIHAWSVLRVFIGKIVEASEVFRDVVFRPPTRETFIPHIRDQEAWKRVRTLIGTTDSLRVTRRSHAFHYPEPDAINAGFAAAGEQEEWSLFTSRARATGFYAFADTASLRAMAASIASEISAHVGDDHPKIIDTLSRDAIKASNAIQTLIENMVPAVLLEFEAAGDFVPVFSMDDPRVGDGKTFKIPPLTRGESED
jgi:hypothetical protein